MTILIYSYFIAMALSVLGLLYEVFINKSEDYTWLEFFGLLFVSCVPILNYLMSIGTIWLFWVTLKDALDVPINKRKY